MDLTIDPQASALVMVDMQNDFCHPDGFYGRANDRLVPLGLNPALVAATVAGMRPLLETARRAGLFIVHTRIERDAGSDAVHIVHRVVPQTFEAVASVLGDPALTPGSWGA